MWFYAIKHNNNFFIILIITPEIILLNENLEFVSQLFVKTKRVIFQTQKHI